MKSTVKAVLKATWDMGTHALGHFGGRYYFEDFVRVYPGDVRFDRLGRARTASPQQQRNFLNHRKFYAFAAQFVRGARVIDLGCGSGYGSALLKEAGAETVLGVDASTHAVRFAREHFGKLAKFEEGSITLLLDRPGTYDVAVCSEVLEHLKEYGKAADAISEIQRVVRPGGVVVIGTPNSEMLGDHGFSFEEMTELLRPFAAFRLYENALVPFDAAARARWEDRQRSGRTGVIVSEAIRLDETMIPEGATPEVKTGVAPGVDRLGELEVRTDLLHNTHSWAAVARVGEG